MERSSTVGVAAKALEHGDHARYVEWLEAENERLKEETKAAHGLVGESPSIRAVHEFIRKAGPVDSNVLITGESGAGKELVARAIHRNSRRRNGPLVTVNCGAIVRSLLESELFGHEKGSFTGAVSRQKGKIEAADGGTLFLDEIGEMPLDVQATLLRVLQEREFQRLGGTDNISVDVRIIAATNRDLEEAVRKGLFRRDLFFRLGRNRLQPNG